MYYDTSMYGIFINDNNNNTIYIHTYIQQTYTITFKVILIGVINFDAL